MKHTFCATEGIPGTEEFTILMFSLESKDANNVKELEVLVRKAVKQYALTDEGVAEYEGNCENFNWGDMINCSDKKGFQEICKNLDLTVEWLGTAEQSWLDYSEQLMDNLHVDVACIKWDTDGEDAKDLGLPSKVTLDIDDPTMDIADALTDEYGYCIESYSVEGVF